MDKEFTFFPNERLKSLIDVFNELFGKRYNTYLVGGANEPYYRAVKLRSANDEVDYHQVIFTRDYFSSALHEIAHWCVAGPERRGLDDYGYWYAPDGRSSEQQAEFEKVEVKPQAMERIFSQAAGQKFRVSADNLEAELGASEAFISNIHRQTLHYCHNGLPKRAQAFAEGVAKAFQQPYPLQEKLYLLEDIAIG